MTTKAELAQAFDLAMETCGPQWSPGELFVQIMADAGILVEDDQVSPTWLSLVWGAAGELS